MKNTIVMQIECFNNLMEKFKNLTALRLKSNDIIIFKKIVI
jgi:hypothetical protein